MSPTPTWHDVWAFFAAMAIVWAFGFLSGFSVGDSWGRWITRKLEQWKKP